MMINYHNRSRVPEDVEKELEAVYSPDLKDLLTTSDVISLSCPLNDQTRGLIGEKEIALMKDGVFLVNTARGPVVNEKALIEALWSGKIERAGFDVFDNEPNIKYVCSDRICIIRYLTIHHQSFLQSERKMRSAAAHWQLD